MTRRPRRPERARRSPSSSRSRARGSSRTASSSARASSRRARSTTGRSRPARSRALSHAHAQGARTLAIAAHARAGRSRSTPRASSSVRLEVEHHLWRGARQVAKFVAMGTAIGFDADARAGRTLRGAPSLRLVERRALRQRSRRRADFVTLLARRLPSGHGRDGHLRLRARPARSCATTAARTRRSSEYTQAFFDARETAMERLQQDLFREWPARARPTRPIGIVGDDGERADVRRHRPRARPSSSSRRSAPRSRPCARRPPTSGRPARPWWCRWTPEGMPGHARQPAARRAPRGLTRGPAELPRLLRLAAEPWESAGAPDRAPPQVGGGHPPTTLEKRRRSIEERKLLERHEKELLGPLAEHPGSST